MNAASITPHKALVTAITKSLSTQASYEIKAEKLIHIRDNDMVRTLSKLYVSFISDSDMSHLPDFLRDMDQLIEKYIVIDDEPNDPGELPEDSTMEVVPITASFSTTLLRSLSRK